MVAGWWTGQFMTPLASADLNPPPLFEDTSSCSSSPGISMTLDPTPSLSVNSRQDSEASSCSSSPAISTTIDPTPPLAFDLCKDLETSCSSSPVISHCNCL
ncbi:hypothetical protein K435DRAFT_853470 [Dendrothele bispora CBS 962.96]|uniref:Uncharacterized protein n=1 Tax=Dendrothele bispora (strain CBS 962.96) TaxID=1314807 RepID=A0A4S8MGI0_DENBC|nr:hypothetical protein K435DRAFT_853470 [Dendrothele bispora CBS 962.96]